jgi:hypothetical protein
MLALNFEAVDSSAQVVRIESEGVLLQLAEELVEKLVLDVLDAIDATLAL